MKILWRQRGFLLVVAILIIVLISMMASVVVYMYVNSNTAETSYTAAKESFYIAESGVNRAIYQFLKRANPCRVGMSGAACCNALDVNNIKFADGEYTLNATYYHPDPIAYLAVTIPVNYTGQQIYLSSTSGYAPSGRVIIDLEAFDYNGISGNVLLNVRRAVAGTKLGVHLASIYTKVRQTQCSFSAVAGVPNLKSITSALGKRTVTANVMENGFPGNTALGELVGRVCGNKPLYIAYRMPDAWYRASEDSGLVKVDLFSITRSPDGVYGWIVGEGGGVWYSNLSLWGFSPAGIPPEGSETWHFQSSPVHTDLYSVTPVANTGSAWAVGDADSYYSYNIIKIDCSNASCIITKANTPSNPSRAGLRGVSMNAAGTFGMAVDEFGNILQYQNNTWSKVAWGVESPYGLFGAAPLTAVKVVSDDEVWVNGDNVYKIVPSIQPGKWRAILVPGVHHNFDHSDHENMALLIENGVVVDGWIVGQGNHVVRYRNGVWVDASYTGMGGGEGVGIIASYFAAAVGGGHRLSLFDGVNWQNDPNGGPDRNWGSDANQISLVAPYDGLVSVWTP